MKAKKNSNGVKDLHNEKIYKTFSSEVKVVDDTKRTLVVAISTPNADRSHDTMDMKGMQYSNFIKNPVVLFAHQYDTKPIAKCLNLQVTAKAAVATVEFTPEGLYEEADIIYQMYKQGFLNAWSIGFMPIDYDPNQEGGYDFKQWELFEFSSVPVPDNPEALTIMRSKGINVDKLLKEEEAKGVLPYKETPKAPEDQAWDAGEQVKAATVDDLKIMCAWVDSANEDNKGAYKLPHHEAAGEHAVVWRGVAAAMGALLGAQGGVDIPDGDRKGVYNHLKKHYAQFDKDVPDFKAYTDIEIKALFPEEEPEEEEDQEKQPKVKATEEEAKTALDEATKTIKALEEENTKLRKINEFKHDEKVRAKDVQELVALAYTISDLDWLIYAFGQNGVSQESVDKMNQALQLLMEVAAMQTTIGQKGFFVLKAGRTLSATHEQMLKDACDYMTKAMGHVNTVLDSVAPAPDTDDGNKDDLNGDTFNPDVMDDGKGVKPSEFLRKLQNSLKTNNQKQDLTLRLLKQIKSSKGVK